MKIKDLITSEFLTISEKWSQKYKRSIDCKHPKGFSQKAHCAARRKRRAGGHTKSKPVYEAISLDLAKKYRRAWNPNFYKDIFMNYPADQRDRNAYRIYLPYEKQEKTIIVPRDIIQALNDKGYDVVDYKEGLAKQKTGKRIMKIGKLLSDNPELQKKFNNDPQRSTSKIADKLVVISRHPYDIAGMSTGRGWASCMNLIDGSYRKYVINDVKAGTLIAYLIRGNDRNITKPISRILIKPFTGVSDPSDIVLYPEEKQYGADDDKFAEIVKDWCNEQNGPDKTGLYCLSPSLYPDSNERIVLGNPKEYYLKNELIWAGLDRLDISHHNVRYDRSKKEFVLQEWTSFEDFLRDIDDNAVSGLLQIALGEKEWQPNNNNEEQCFAETIRDLEPYWQEKILTHAGYKIPLDADIPDAVKKLRDTDDPYWQAFEHLIKNEKIIREKAWDRIAEYAEIGWWFYSHGIINIPTTKDALKTFVESGSEVRLTLDERSMVDLASYTDIDDEDAAENGIELWRIRDHGLDAVEWENLDEHRGPYGSKLTDNLGDDTWESGLSTSWADEYVAMLEKIGGKIDDPRQSQLLEKYLKRLQTLSGL